MAESRLSKIANFAGEGNLSMLKDLLCISYSQLELNVALENAIAYSQIEVAEYLLEMGADFSHDGYNSVYYAVHNNELGGLKFAISRGIDININDGMLLNCCIYTALNSNNTIMFNWLLENGARLDLLTTESIKLVEEWGNEELKSMIFIN